MHIAALTKDGFLTKIQEVVDIIRRERKAKEGVSRNKGEEEEEEEEEGLTKGGVRSDASRND